MSLLQASFLVLAGGIAGVMNAVVGAGSLITFPTLLLLGYPPVLANVSNTLGLVPGSVMATFGYRATLHGRAPVVIRLVAAVAVGGVTGAALLVLLPGRAFDVIVPWLLLAAAVLAALQPRISAAIDLRRAVRGVPHDGATTVSASVVVLVGLTGVYGGYFGAAQGVILLVILGLALGGPLNQLNGVKNILGGTANLVAAVVFMVISDVDWVVAGLIALGSTIGGGLGGRYGRRLPSSALRVLLVTIAVVAAAVRFLG